MEASADDVYQLKRITFQGRPVQIVLQNLNGPCPLLAITNVLLLAGKLSLQPVCGVPTDPVGRVGGEDGCDFAFGRKTVLARAQR